MASQHAHTHTGLIGVFGLTLGVVLMVWFPKLEVVADALVLVALFHLIGLIVLLGSVYSFAPRFFGRLLARRRSLAADEQGYDFGWSWGAMNGHFVAAAAVFSIALGLQLAWPAWWPLWFVVALLGFIMVIGGMLLRTSKRLDFALLPLVDFLRSDHDTVLDAGCGGGRTTLALTKVLKNGRIVALDRFDADYIDGGGRALFQRNLRLAGLDSRVQVEQGNIAAMPFADASFDAAISTHVIDHMKDQKQAGLAEIRRVLKPGGRFLLVVWVPGLATFSLANVFCFFLTTKAGWRKLAGAVDLTVRDEGTFNGMYFMVLERPS